MGKKLLSDDCNSIVLESFRRSDIDHSDYYQNKIDEHFTNDERIIEKLKLAITRWIELYKDYVSKFTVGTNWDEKAKAWEIVAEKDRYTIKIFLPPEWGLDKKVDLAFFENHLRIIEEIERQRKLEKLEIGSYILERIKTNIDNLKDNTNPLIPDLKKVMSIPTKATKDEILNFWFKLLGNNAKGKPYWNKEEIEHFVNQNFEGFPGVKEIKEFNPNMNKIELNQVTWYFFNRFDAGKTKEQYANMLIKNFTKFKSDDPESVYSNIADRSNKHLSKLFK